MIMLTKQELEAGRKVVTEKIGPVRVQRVRPVGVDGQTLQVQVQQFATPNTGNPLLSIMMAGHTSFNSKRSRIAWQNMHIEQVKKLNLPFPVGVTLESLPREGYTFSADNPELCPIFQFPKPNAESETDPKKMYFNTCIVERDSFTPRSWRDGNGVPQTQAPKKAGADGENLTYNGEFIYRNTFLSFEGLTSVQDEFAWDEDLIIAHNNTIEGSIARAAREAVSESKDGVGEIILPGGEHRIVEADRIAASGTSATGRDNTQAYGQGAGLGKENQPASTSSQALVVGKEGEGHVPPAADSEKDQQNKELVKSYAEVSKETGGGETRNPKGSMSAKSQDDAAKDKGNK